MRETGIKTLIREAHIITLWGIRNWEQISRVEFRELLDVEDGLRTMWAARGKA